MADTIVAIHQPNFIPWLGYFQKIAWADKFVFLDDAEASKTTSYVNSADLLVGCHKKKITVPIIKPKGNPKLVEIEIFRDYLSKKFIKTLHLEYKKSPFYVEIIKLIEELVDKKFNRIVDFNIEFITKTCTFANLETEFYYSSDLEVNKTKADRLIELCTKLDADVYLSGLGASNYQIESDFTDAGIILNYIKYQNMKYNQAFTEDFIPNLSVIDFLMNHGFSKLRGQLLPVQNNHTKLM